MFLDWLAFQISSAKTHMMQKEDTMIEISHLADLFTSRIHIHVRC